jgi:hypothetical protein
MVCSVGKQVLGVKAISNHQLTDLRNTPTEYADSTHPTRSGTFHLLAAGLYMHLLAAGLLCGPFGQHSSTQSA